MGGGGQCFLTTIRVAKMTAATAKAGARGLSMAESERKGSRARSGREDISGNSWSVGGGADLVNIGIPVSEGEGSEGWWLRC